MDDLIERVNSADQEIAELKTRLVACGDIKADKLEKIHGIGPVISKKLNDAGIYTFEELGVLSQERVEEIVGPEIRNLADEDSLIREAREFAKKKS